MEGKLLQAECHKKSVGVYREQRTRFSGQFAATWVDLEIIILSTINQKEKDKYRMYMWNLKYDTNELIYKTETDSQT